jgi:hypothetical protein
LGFLFLSLSMVGLTATASTPDGETPAVETVCDPLNADDVTDGLYGLCLAFCEAQDLASEEVPITDEELAILQDTPPSGSILNTYNTIKKETDPDMPCIVVDSTCPCWSEEELAAIDGNTPSGNGSTLCIKQPDPQAGIVDAATAIEVEDNRQSIRASASDSQRFDPPVQRCQYRNIQVTPSISRFLDVGQGTMTSGQAAACLQEVVDRCALLGN